MQGGGNAVAGRCGAQELPGGTHRQQHAEQNGQAQRPALARRRAPRKKKHDKQIKKEGKYADFVTFVDINNLNKTEQSLRASEKKYRSLILNIPDVTWTSDPKIKTTFISPNVKNIIGYTSEEVLAGGVGFDRIHPDDKKTMLQSYNLLFKKGIKYDVEYRYKTKYFRK